jgi:MerR family transcriptional regulator, light-induced transcriptional regulator
VKGLAIREVAERTGIAAGTIRMWEQRYGFPEPRRTASGYRMYDLADVDVLKRVNAYRERGLSIPAALERARANAHSLTDRPSLYGAIATAERPVVARMLKKKTLIALSRAIEDETLARAASPIVFGAFQRVRHYTPVEHRYRRMAERADALAVFADFDEARVPERGPIELPISPDDALGNEWAVVVDAPGYSAALLAWEPPTPEPVPDRERRFEAFWTMDASVVRRASLAGAALAKRADPDLGERLEALLADRPLAVESPAPGLEALAHRMITYLEDAA